MKKTLAFLLSLTLLLSVICFPSAAGDEQDWIPLTAPTDYAYAIAVVCDTQYMNLRYPDVYTGIYDWLVANAKKQKLAFVMGLGDITDASTPEEWARADREIHRLDKVVPYSILRGNHDKEEDYNKTFPKKEFKVDGSFDDTMLNTYQLLSISGNDYLFMNLDYGASNEALAWAAEITEQYPDRQVIVSTHDYMNSDGTLTTNGKRIWNNYVKKHENIALMLCGHSDGSVIQRSITYGEKGNIIAQFMINAQELDDPYKGLGMIALLYFSADGKTVQLRYYSTAKDACYLAKNQFRFDMAPDQIRVDVNFTDIDSHWGRDYILPLAEQAIIKGKTDTTFEPDANITRAEFLTLALKVARIEAGHGESYSDVSLKAWFAGTLYTAKKMGLIDENMVKNDLFFPDQNITREEMTSIIVKLYESKKGPAPQGTATFTDGDTFSDWTKESISKASALGIVTGNPDGSFNARGNATRAEAAVIFTRLQKLL